MFGFDMLLIEWDIIHQLTNIIFAKMHYFKIVGGFLSLLSCVQCCTVQYAGTTLCYIELTDTAHISAAQDLWPRKNTSSTGPDPTVVLQVSEHS